MHVYVFFRAASVPFLKRKLSRKRLVGAAIILWTLLFLGRIVRHNGAGVFSGTLEFLGMTWMATLFLIFVCLLAVDVATLFGIILNRFAPFLRGVALIAGGLLSVIALFQGLRPPVIEKYEVALQGLPAALDGTVLIALSDMHLGSQIGSRWLAGRIEQVKAQQPDIVVLLGDIFEGHGPPAERLIDTFRQLSAPLGVYAVTGNHEFHGNGSIGLFGNIGIKLLRDEWAEIHPGLVVAGIDDLTNRRRRNMGGNPIAQAVNGRPSGACILLSHTPWRAEQAAESGVGLMLSGHTHGGQIWPFDYLVRSRYPLLEGRYDVNGMTAIVCRGTGTWGPRMRLWHPGEILHVTLRPEE